MTTGTFTSGSRSPDVAEADRARLEAAWHPRCVVCGPARDGALGVHFTTNGEGPSVAATFDCDPRFEGYDGQLHGGIVSCLLDGATAHCLFALGRVAYTADLSVRYRQPVRIGRPAVVTGRLERSRGRLHTLTAELLQDGVVRATARARFLEGR